ncbi:RHS domain-containing protein [Xanthomonas campestris pv. phormiicola]|nr:RHS domain-containing protein [Xanthomonas campestris pv. phormiicola]UYC15187.1 RHS domain-containing protein [Xanthomonas campestris pv. phormiicola]
MKRTIILLLLSLFLMATANAQTVIYYHTDALGTPVAVTDASGNVVERSEYEPYGSLLNRPLTDGPGYTGHVMDAATGLAYMQQRYYDPAIGVMLSVDPVTAYESNDLRNFNRYSYGNNNPYKFTDPDGRQSTLARILRSFPPYSSGTHGRDEQDDSPSSGSSSGKDTNGDGRPDRGIRSAARDPVRRDRQGNPVSQASNASPDPDGADNAAEADSAAGKLPTPPTGPGSVPKSERDPKRLFSDSEREAKRAEQGHQCANGCGKKIDGSNSAGHHIKRHADGGRTVPENHAEVCTQCHKDLHSGN